MASGKGNSGKPPGVGSRSGYKVTWAQAVRDMVIASMNRGQLPVLSLMALILIFVFKLPPEDASKLAFRIFDRLESGSLLGWLLSIVLVFGWYFHARSMRKEYSLETERIGTEKAKLQGQVAGKKLPGSQRPAKR